LELVYPVIYDIFADVEIFCRLAECQHIFFPAKDFSETSVTHYYQLRKVAQPGWPRYWLITSDDDVPTVKANLGDCELSEAKMRFVLWMEGKSWS
jgi:hypothetical protein